MSKGSKPRSIDKNVYDTNFDKIFGEKPFSSLVKKEPKKRSKKVKPSKKSSSEG